MTIKDNRDYIYVLWKSVAPSARRFIIGEISKNGEYEFNYGHEIENAIKEGFTLIPAFADRNETYSNTILFPAFSSRLPDRKRVDIDDILKKYHMETYDAFELLKRSGARLPIDKLEFIDPIPDNINENISREFYISRVNDNFACKGDSCKVAPLPKIKDKVTIIPEPTNEYDVFAQKLMFENMCLGYIPRYYAKQVDEAIRNGHGYDAEIIEVTYNNELNCNECMKVKLTIFANK